MHAPIEVHWIGAIHVLSYVKGTPGNGLLYRKYGHLNVETSLILTMQEIKLIGNLFLITVPMLEGIWSLGIVRSKM